MSQVVVYFMHARVGEVRFFRRQPSRSVPSLPVPYVCPPVPSRQSFSAFATLQKKPDTLPAGTGDRARGDAARRAQGEERGGDREVSRDRRGGEPRGKPYTASSSRFVLRVGLFRTGMHGL